MGQHADEFRPNRRDPLDAPGAPGVPLAAMPPTREPIVTAAGEMRSEPVYDVDELAGLLGTSPRTVRRRVNAGLWPHIRGHRGRLLFTPEHVRLIVAAFNVAHDYPAHEPRNRWEK